MTTIRKFSLPLALAITLGGTAWAPAALATLIVQNANVRIEANPSPLNTTPVSDPGGNPVGEINVDGGTIRLRDYNNAPLATSDPYWWDAPGVAYTTTTAGINVFFDNLSVTGFTFNIGANQDARAWIKAYYTDASGATKTLTTGWINDIGYGNTPSAPGFGVYTQAGSCARITRVEIDPTFVWGIGNFGLAQTDRCVSVPEPGTAALLGLGLMAMGLGRLAHRRRRNQSA